MLSKKLDKIAICLKLSPYDGRGNYKEKLLPISCNEIEPAYVICPTSFICGTLECQPRCLIQSTQENDIPMVALIKGHTVHQNVPVLTGKCPSCAPCGVVIAWTRFAKSESPTNILNFLGSVYQTEDSRPDYVCIDKDCEVLATAVANRSWEIWKKTTRFIVDAYHYINHRVLDYLC